MRAATAAQPCPRDPANWAAMAIRLEDQELAALSGQLPEIWQLYIVLRMFMDYRTGLVGVSRGISWRSLQDELYVEPGPGLVDSGTPTKAKLRRLAERMARAGLVSNRHTPKQLVFFLPLAPRDTLASNKPGTKPAQTRQTHPGTSPASNGAGWGPDPPPTRQVPTSTGTVEPGTPPESGLRREVVLTHVSIADRPRAARPTGPTPEVGCADAVQCVFAYWQRVMNKPSAKLDAKRRAAIAARLKDGYRVSELQVAIDGCRSSAWHQGQNDRQRPFNDLALICRDGAHVEQFIELAQGQRLSDAKLAEFLNGGQPSRTLEGDFHVVR